MKQTIDLTELNILEDLLQIEFEGKTIDTPLSKVS